MGKAAIVQVSDTTMYQQYSTARSLKKITKIPGTQPFAAGYKVKNIKQRTDYAHNI
jgi:hypothetical protein